MGVLPFPELDRVQHETVRKVYAHSGQAIGLDVTMAESLGYRDGPFDPHFRAIETLAFAFVPSTRECLSVTCRTAQEAARG